MSAELAPGLLIGLALAIALAGLVHGTLGLGFPVVATPLLALTLDLRTAIVLTLLPTAAVNIASILRGGGWREVLAHYWPFVLAAVAGATFGARALVVLDPAPFKALLALLIVAYLLMTRDQPLRFPWMNANGRFSMLGFGLAAGLSAGTTNVMVPIMIMYTLELGLARKTTVQLFNLCFLAGKVSQFAVISSAGLLTADALGTSAVLALVALACLYVGMRIGERIERATYARWVRRLLLVLAIVLAVQFGDWLLAP